MSDVGDQSRRPHPLLPLGSVLGVSMQQVKLESGTLVYSPHLLWSHLF